MNLRFGFLLLLLFGLLFAGAGLLPGAFASEPSSDEIMALYPGISELSKRLTASMQQSDEDRLTQVAVSDFAGPGSEVFVLGEHIADKLNEKLFTARVFPHVVERKELHRIMEAHMAETSPLFDPETVIELGKLTGINAMVIGKIEDMGRFIDVSAKVVAAETGKIHGLASVRLKKDDTITALLYKKRTTSLTVTISPAIAATVVANGQKVEISGGMVILEEMPYGKTTLLVKPNVPGYLPAQAQVMIRKKSQTLDIEMEKAACAVRLQIIPPDSALMIDGSPITLDDVGVATFENDTGNDLTAVVKAEGYGTKIETFNPCEKSFMAIRLDTDDPFYQNNDALLHKVQSVKAKQRYNLSLSMNKTTYRLGDTILFSVRSDRDCYLNLILVNSKGEMTQIFPNQFHSDNFIRGGRTYTIPDASYGFDFTVSPPAGTEKIYALASDRKTTIVGDDFSQEAFRSVTRKTRDISVVKRVGVKINQAILDAAAVTVYKIEE